MADFIGHIVDAEDSLRVGDHAARPTTTTVDGELIDAPDNVLIGSISAHTVDVTDGVILDETVVDVGPPFDKAASLTTPGILYG